MFPDTQHSAPVDPVIKIVPLDGRKHTFPGDKYKHQRSIIQFGRLQSQQGRTPKIFRIIIVFLASTAICIATMSVFAGVLSAMEYENFEDIIEQRNDLQSSMDAIFANKVLTDEEKRFVEDYYKLKFTRWDENPWTWRSSFYFVGTVMSTIGYGWYWPETLGGQLFTAFVILPCIPILCVSSFFYAYTVVYVTHEFVTAVIAVFAVDARIRFLSFHSTRESYHNFITLLIFVFSFSMLGWLISVSEDWSFETSIYFVWVSSFTAGITGDAIAKSTLSPLMLILQTHFFMTTFGIMLMVVEFLIQEIFHDSRLMIDASADTWRRATNHALERMTLAIDRVKQSIVDKGEAKRAISDAVSGCMSVEYSQRMVEEMHLGGLQGKRSSALHRISTFLH